ncbi:sugar ABC transporter ATP-binding protein [Andreprevotia chitinilytica]|uniref:sugar ABC transporter ATP-binding protein n=1 Tax=Andreprevotia chitinilytica TaxID=396808 RepID=UPI000689D4A7|nr:sugar ABC transporter ATP-binding protein [Andreprevotia chitinilytica]
MPAAVLPPPLLALRQIRKRFGATIALDGVDLTLRAGEVVALMGANGAGKSTLVKIIAGASQADDGELRLAGDPIRFDSPRAALNAGIATVHQQTSQLGVPGLSVAENLLLGRLCSAHAAAWLAPATIRQQAATIAAAIAPDLPLDADFADLTPAQRQLLALARALHESARLIIFDEPTASLSPRESARLFAVIDHLKQAGIAILYVSHRLADLRRIADRAVVLRNGRVAGEFAAPLDLDAAVRAMVGGALPVRHAAARPPTQQPRLELQQVQLLPDSTPFNLCLHAGEVVAITGNLGAGKSRLLQVLFGLRPLPAGRLLLDGVHWQPRSVAEAIDAGIFMAGEDRWRSSFLPVDSLGARLSDLIALPHLRRLFPDGWVKQQQLDDTARSWIQRLGIRCQGPHDTPDQLSGGNQQKIVLARWQSAPAKVLLLDEPFQGVDVGARHDLIASIRSNPDTAVLIATSDLEEALEVADRVLIMGQHTLYDPGQGRDADSLLGQLESLEQFAGALPDHPPLSTTLPMEVTA